MKKFLSLTLILMLSLVVVACGGAGSNPQQGGNTDGETNTDTDTTNSGETYVFELGHGGAIDGHIYVGGEKFKELVEEKSNGQVKINVHPNSVLGAEREMAESVQTGLLDMAMLSTGPLGNFADKVNALDFPFLFKDRHHAYRVLDGEVGEQINAQLEAANFKNLYWFENGTHHIVTNSKPVYTPEDLAGLKMRVQENQIQIDTFNALGANATPVPFSELFLAAQQGVVDGQGQAFPVLIPNKYYEVHDYITTTGHMYSAGMILINNEKFSSLPGDIQEILLEAAKEAGQFEREFVAELETEYRKIATDNGMTIIDDVDLAPFREAVKPVYDKYKDKYGEIHQLIAETE